MRYISIPISLERSNSSIANNEITLLWVEVDESGNATREIGLNNQMDVVHAYPSDRFKHGRRGLLDMSVVSASSAKSDITKEDFETLWHRYNPFAHIESDIEEFAKTLTNDLPAGSFTIVKNTPPPGALYGTSIKLEPIRKGCASIWLSAVNKYGGVDAEFGRGTIWEESFTGEAYFGVETIVNSFLAKACLAVIHGQFTESLWNRDGEIVRNIGDITIDGKRIRSRHLQIGGILFFWMNDHWIEKYLPWE